VLSSGFAAAQHRTKSSPFRRRMNWDSSRKQRGGEFEGWGEKTLVMHRPSFVRPCAINKRNKWKINFEKAMLIPRSTHPQSLIL
jgi:hypothetical protein